MKKPLRTTSLLNNSQLPRCDLETGYRSLSFDTDPPRFHQNFTPINTQSWGKKKKPPHCVDGGLGAAGSLWP